MKIDRLITEGIEVSSEAPNKKAIEVQWLSHHMLIDQQQFLYSDLKFEVGGNQNSLIFLYRPQKQDIYLQLNSQLKDFLIDVVDAAEKNQNFKKLIQKSRSHQVKDFTFIGIFLTFIIALIYFRAPMAGALSHLFPQSIEKKLADQIFKSDSQDQIQSKLHAEKALNDILITIQGFDTQKYFVHLSAQSELNAYATIGGHIFVNKGLIQSLKSYEQLLAVVSHEMVHAQERHIIKNIFQSAGLFLIIQSLLGDITGLVAVLADGGGPLLQLSYSRELETEADVKAVRILIESDLNPLALSEALTIIEKQMSRLKSELPGSEILKKIEKNNFLRSHPTTADRALIIQNEALKLGQKIIIKNKLSPLQKQLLAKKWLDLQDKVNQL